MRIRLIAAVAALALSVSGAWAQWTADILGNGFEKRYVTQPADYSGEVRCTVMRYLPPDSTPAHSGRGVLYVHGFNDYFFQKELAEKFAAHGFDFYAVDLRKYGRSILPGQKMFEARSLKEYFQDIDSALSIMQRAGEKEIVLMGHSTGGLICAYYIECNPTAPVRALVLNSPFLDWNLGKTETFVPLVAAAGAVLPNLKISQSGASVYAESLDKNYHGEWHFNTKWKLHESPDVTAGWVRAINSAQDYLKEHERLIKIPVLVMFSDHSYSADTWSEDAQKSDAVLDVADIKKYGSTLGTDVTLAEVPGGMHDLILSSKPVREGVYRYIFNWLSKQGI